MISYFKLSCDFFVHLIQRFHLFFSQTIRLFSSILLRILHSYFHSYIRSLHFFSSSNIFPSEPCCSTGSFILPNIATVSTFLLLRSFKTLRLANTNHQAIYELKFCGEFICQYYIDCVKKISPTSQFKKKCCIVLPPK